jgi:hypothetical protein
MLNTEDSIALFAPLHPPPPSLATPPSDEVDVLVGWGGAFVKVLVGRSVSV